jgi:hypothetical protein
MGDIEGGLGIGAADARGDNVRGIGAGEEQSHPYIGRARSGGDGHY